MMFPACCKNFPDSQWYTFDDTKVTRVSEADVVGRTAYLLFYQRRSIEVTQTDHWLLENIDIPRTAAPVSKSHEDLLVGRSTRYNLHRQRLRTTFSSKLTKHNFTILWNSIGVTPKKRI